MIFWKWIALPLLAVTIIKSILDRNLLEKIAEILYHVAWLIDCMANVLLQVPLNLFFVSKGGYKYGQAGESISSATGKNEIYGRLTGAGIIFTELLSFFFGKDHAIKSIEIKE